MPVQVSFDVTARLSLSIALLAHVGEKTEHWVKEKTK